MIFPPLTPEQEAASILAWKGRLMNSMMGSTVTAILFHISGCWQAAILFWICTFTVLIGYIPVVRKNNYYALIHMKLIILIHIIAPIGAHILLGGFYKSGSIILVVYLNPFSAIFFFRSRNFARLILLSYLVSFITLTVIDDKIKSSSFINPLTPTINKIVQVIAMIGPLVDSVAVLESLFVENQNYQDRLEDSCQWARVICEHIAHMDLDSVPPRNDEDDDLLKMLHQIVDNIKVWRPYIPEALFTTKPNFNEGNMSATIKGIDISEKTSIYSYSGTDSLASARKPMSIKNESFKTPHIEQGLSKGKATVLLIRQHNFVALCEQIELTTAAALQRKLFKEIHRLIRKNAGNLLSFSGGDVWAFWLGHSPNKACDCALDIKRLTDNMSINLFGSGAMSPLAIKLDDKINWSTPPMIVSQSLVFGTFCYGNVGSDTSQSYSLSGPGIDACSSLCHYSAYYGIYGISVNEEVKKSSQFQYSFQPIDCVRLAKHDSFSTSTVYELICIRENEANEWMYEVDITSGDNLFEGLFKEYLEGNYRYVVQQISVPNSVTMLRLRNMAIDAQKQNRSKPNKNISIQVHWDGIDIPNGCT